MEGPITRREFVAMAGAAAAAGGVIAGEAVPRAYRACVIGHTGRGD